MAHQERQKSLRLRYRSLLICYLDSGSAEASIAQEEEKNDEPPSRQRDKGLVFYGGGGGVV